MLLDRTRVKFWQKWVFGFMAILMAAFLIMIPISGKGCGGQSSATEQIDKDIARYKKAVKLDPTAVDSWRQLGEAYVIRANQQTDGSAAQQADWRAGASAYERAVKLLARQKGTQAKQAKQQRVDTLEQLASVYLFLKDFKLATSVYGQLTDLRPKDAQYFFDMASVAISAGDTNTALLAFQRFLELDPTSPDAAAVKQWIKDNAPSPAPSSEGTGQ